MRLSIHYELSQNGGVHQIQIRCIFGIENNTVCSNVVVCTFKVAIDLVLLTLHQQAINLQQSGGK